MPRRRRHGPRLLDLFAFQQIELQPRGNAARLGQDVQQQPARQPLLFCPAAAILLQLEPPDGRQDVGLQGDVDAVGAAFRPIGGQAGRAGHPGRHGPRLLVLPRPLKGHHGHRPGRGGGTELVGQSAQKSDHGRGRIGHHRLQQGPRAAGHFQQVGNRPAPAAGGGQHDPPGRIVDLLDELFGREEHTPL